MMNTKPENRQSIEAALALVRKRESETFDLTCVCAKHDRPYTLCFRRKPGGLFGLVENVRVPEQALSEEPSEDETRVSAPVKLDLSEFESKVFPCPWCGDKSINHCARHCGAFVCGGLIVGGMFHCRASCGASWIGWPLKRVGGHKGQPSNTLPAFNPRPMLGSGQAFAIRKK